MAEADEKDTSPTGHVHALTAISLIHGVDMPGDTTGEARARRALYYMMVASPVPPPGKTKEDFQQEWQLRFGISGRVFDSLWNWAIAKTGVIAYSKTGPRGPHSPTARANRNTRQR